MLSLIFREIKTRLKSELGQRLVYFNSNLFRWAVSAATKSHPPQVMNETYLPGIYLPFQNEPRQPADCEPIWVMSLPICFTQSRLCQWFFWTTNLLDSTDWLCVSAMRRPNFNTLNHRYGTNMVTSRPSCLPLTRQRYTEHCVCAFWDIWTTTQREKEKWLTGKF